jgi:hypothetical protein
MNELDECGGLDVPVTAVPAGATGQHDEQRTQSFAAARDDVLGDAVDQGYGALQAAANDLIDGDEVGADEPADVIERHGREITAESCIVAEASPAENGFRLGTA